MDLHVIEHLLQTSSVSCDTGICWLCVRC